MNPVARPDGPAADMGADADPAPIDTTFVVPDDCDQCNSDAQDVDKFGPCATATAAWFKDAECQEYEACVMAATTGADQKRCRAAFPKASQMISDAVDLCLNETCRDSCMDVSAPCEQCLLADDTANCKALADTCDQKMSCKTTEDCFDACDLESDTTTACNNTCEMTRDPGYTELEACQQDQCLSVCAADGYTSYACDQCREIAWEGKDVAKACATKIAACAGDMYCKTYYDCLAGCHSNRCSNQCDTDFDAIVNNGVAQNVYDAAVKKYNAIPNCSKTACTTQCQ